MIFDHVFDEVIFNEKIKWHFQLCVIRRSDHLSLKVFFSRKFQFCRRDEPVQPEEQPQLRRQPAGDVTNVVRVVRR